MTYKTRAKAELKEVKSTVFSQWILLSSLPPSYCLFRKKKQQNCTVARPSIWPRLVAVCAVHVRAPDADATFPFYFCCGPKQVPQCLGFWSFVAYITLHGSLDTSSKSLWRRVANRGKLIQCS